MSRAVYAALSHRQAPFADRILEVRYEDMVRDLEATVRRICSFLGEAFEPEMLNWHGRVHVLFADAFANLHSKLHHPILADEAMAWRRRLSIIECFLIEASLFRELEAMGYGLRFANSLWRPLLASVGAMIHAVAPLLDWALPALLRREYLPRPLFI